MKSFSADISPQVPSVVGCKRLGTYIPVTGYECVCNSVFVQDATAELQLQLADAKTRLENQESETQKADSKFQFSVAEMEKLETSFEAKRNVWAEEKTALMQWAEKAEDQF